MKNKEETIAGKMPNEKTEMNSCIDNIGKALKTLKTYGECGRDAISRGRDQPYCSPSKHLKGSFKDKTFPKCFFDPDGLIIVVFIWAQSAQGKMQSNALDFPVPQKYQMTHHFVVEQYEQWIEPSCENFFSLLISCTFLPRGHLDSLETDSPTFNMRAFMNRSYEWFVKWRCSVG